MPNDHLSQQIFEAKWVANGFPKSGTHLLIRLILPIAPLEGPTEGGFFEQPWAGTFQGNSFTLRRVPLKQTAFRLGRIGNGRMVKGHVGYDPRLAEFIDMAGITHTFIHRDLRDVAVSQAYHILNAEDDERLAHPRPEIYDRDNFDHLLLQVIEGHAGFPGLIERWERFAPWLDDDWTIVTRFEDILADPEGEADRIWAKAMHRMADRFGVAINFDADGRKTVTAVMAESSRQRHLSPTFRQGKAGGWREVFTDEHLAAFEMTGGEAWIRRLGYEESA